MILALLLNSAFNPALDSLSSQMEIEMRSPQINQSLDLELYYQKSKGLRMEMSVFGFSAASLLMHEKQWAMLIPSEEIALEGSDAWIPLGDPIKAPWINPQNLIPALWGDTSKLNEVFSSKDQPQQPTTYKLGKMVPCGNEALCPQSIEFTQGKQILRIKINQKNFQPKFNSKIWQLSKPADYQLIQVPAFAQSESNQIQQCQNDGSKPSPLN